MSHNFRQFLTLVAQKGNKLYKFEKSELPLFRNLLSVDGAFTAVSWTVFSLTTE